MGDRPDLGAGRAERVGGLVAVPSLHPPPAVPAPPDPHPGSGASRSRPGGPTGGRPMPVAAMSVTALGPGRFGSGFGLPLENGAA